MALLKNTLYTQLEQFCTSCINIHRSSGVEIKCYKLQDVYDTFKIRVYRIYKLLKQW